MNPMQSAGYQSSMKERKVISVKKEKKDSIREVMPELFYHIQRCKDNGRDFCIILRANPLFDNIMNNTRIVDLLESEGFKVVSGRFYFKIYWGIK